MTLAGANATTFTNVAFAALLLLVSVSNTVLVAEPFRKGFRLVSVIFLFVNLDKTTCMVNTFVNGNSYQLPNQAASRNAQRFSGALIVLCGVLAFVYAFLFRPHEKMKNLRNDITTKIITCVAAVTLACAQFTVWGMPNPCSPPSATQIDSFPTATTIGISVLLIAAVLFEDRDAFDLAFVKTIDTFVRFPPIFADAASDQSTFRSLWKAYSSLLCIGVIALLVVALMKNSLGELSLGRILSKRMVAQVAIFAAGAAGAICVYVKGPDGLQGAQYNWITSFAWVIPLFHIVHLIFDVQFFSGAALLLCFIVLPSVGDLALSNATNSPGGGYLNAGVVLSYFAALASPLVAVVLGRTFEVKPIHEYFVDENGNGKPNDACRTAFVSSAVLIYLAAVDFTNASGISAFLFSTQLLSGVYMLLGSSSTEIVDVHRIVLLCAAAPIFTGTFWPLGG
eukprot:CAMPEP_0176412160 /NCGR_PEP_ID=MMETSP0127-20121128/3993_1 /TAXON_ID=938130 /ORGANISM="Platyophrya macrostoma, Strain WH" /LENGTH=451 /DNA_ID=CAMNT_0017791807 /DNA_START=30 /DNA_END=1381 /DNA_ORIENTATION=+